MAENDNDASKIIVDDDWKTQAQAEKEKLAAKAKAEAEAASGQPGQAGASGEGGPQKLPPASFSTLANMLLTNCVMALGGMEDPKTKKRFVDLAVAKFYIDNMEVLQEKTKGNLTKEESAFLERALYELRMNFVHITEQGQKVAPEDLPKPEESK
ncbi:MAG: DUF1844 domain-containing protein [Planctomycetota bacterium]|nr:MAG: DUF1844 domain-containing protein [Planctomycetota bacterium]